MTVPRLYLDSIDSTNSYAKRWVNESFSQDMVIVANEQTHGRGQHDRMWVSEAGGGLYYSLLSFGFLSCVEDPKGFVGRVAKSVVTAVRSLVDLPVDVEWPNDLIVGHRKLGGILLETGSESQGEGLKYVIIGVGLNVNQDRFPGALDKTATSIFRETGIRHFRSPFIESITRELMQWR